jgi:tryptophanyl-tRNA synthetase
MMAITDPARRYRKDPGHPDVCNIFRLHNFFSLSDVNDIADKCRKAEIGCVECKNLLAQRINEDLGSFREKRAALAARPHYINEILTDGAQRAARIAKETIREVKEKMGLKVIN